MAVSIIALKFDYVEVELLCSLTLMHVFIFLFKFG